MVVDVVREAAMGGVEDEVLVVLLWSLWSLWSLWMVFVFWLPALVWVQFLILRLSRCSVHSFWLSTDQRGQDPSRELSWIGGARLLGSAARYPGTRVLRTYCMHDSVDVTTPNVPW